MNGWIYAEVEVVWQVLFNIISCYFPIAYTPPKDEPLGITSDDLRKALRSVPQ